jgi:hypothetical protein
VAQALAKSQANTLWLHSVTSVSPEAAEIIARLPGKLLMTGLARLDSVALAEKLAKRPGTLSLPYLKQIKPEIAAALGRNERGLALTGLGDIPPEVQDKLAEAVGYLALPNLRSLDSMPLTSSLSALTIAERREDEARGENRARSAVDANISRSPSAESDIPSG